MARKKKTKEEKIWAYKLKHPEASNREIAIATKASYAYVWKLMSKIGTPKEVLEKDVPRAFGGSAGFFGSSSSVSRETTPEEPLAPPSSATRADILEDALSKINGDRHEEYGDAAENFARIAGYWNAHLGLNAFITPSDVAAMMVLLKISRLHGDGSKAVDTFVDICGYAAIGGEIAGSD